MQEQPAKPKRPKRPRDVNELAVAIAKIATGECEDSAPVPSDPAAMELGRKGGLARAARQTPEQRQAQARMAIAKRWADRSDDA